MVFIPNRSWWTLACPAGVDSLPDATKLCCWRLAQALGGSCRAALGPGRQALHR
jgi:hypothetical protein